MKIGLHAAMLERRYPHPAHALAQAGTLGADHYEIDLGIGLPGELWSERFDRFRQLIPELLETSQRARVQLSSLCLGTLWQTSLASPDPDERAQGVKVIRDVCGVARSLGVSALLLPVGQPEGAEVAAARENVVKSLRQCLVVAEDSGVMLALENVCQPFLEDAEALLEVVTALNSKSCGIYYDLGNPSFVGHDPVTELQQIASHLVRVHAKDTLNVRREKPPLPATPITGDFYVWQRRTTVTLGQGDVDLRGCARNLQNIGYTDSIIIEVPQSPEDTEAGCLDNLQAARQIFGS